MNGKDMQQDMAQNAMDNAAAERAAAEWDAKTDPLDAFKADGTETIRPRDNIRSPLAYGMAEECAWDSGLRHIAIGLTDCGNDVQLITEDGWHLALIQQDPAQEWAEFIVKAVNNHDALVAVLRDIVENYNLCTCPEGYDNVEIWNHEVACTYGDALKVLESAIAIAKGGA
tara:strand:+ start:956 stop:1468 length:513 start_codon:yes stop_codon:yes gene_type:complete